MKIYKYTYMVMSGNCDPYILYNNMSEHYSEVSYFNPFNKNYTGRKNDPSGNPLDGIKISKIFSGNTTTKQGNIDCEIHLDVNIEILSERATLMTEFVFDIQDKQTLDVMLEKINDNFIFEEILTWQCGDETKDCSIISITNDFVMKKFFPFTSSQKLKNLFDEIDPTEKKDVIKYLGKMKEISGLDIDLCGSNQGINSTSSTFGACIILDENKQISLDDSHEKISDEHEIYYSDSLSSYVSFNKETHKEFLGDFKNNNLYEMLIQGYTVSLQMWSFSIKNEAEDLIVNLENKSEVFWKNLRIKIEEWQLHFLVQNTKRIRSMSLVKQTNMLSFNTINKVKRKEWLDGLEKKEKIMLRYVDELKYDLDNIATPGHTHDEQTLQKESETTNERILLLSFLAMSIPMLGAIFSPAFTLSTKIISASVLLCLPIFYFIIFRLSRKRQKNIDTRREFNRKKSQMQNYLEYHESNIKEVKKNDKLADDVKKNIITWEERNIKVTQNMIDKIDKKIK